MIGVGLVASISIFAESAKASINKIIDDSFVGDLVIDSGTFGFGGLSPDLAVRLNQLPEVEAASGVRVGFAEIDGEAQTLFGIDPATMGSIVDVGVLNGRVEDLGVDDIAVHEDYAADQGWGLGDTIDVTFAQTGVKSLTLSVIYAKNELAENFFIGNPAFEANYPDIFDFQVYVLRSPDATPDEARSAVEAVAADYANAEVQDLDQYKQAQADQINQLLGLVYALLGLAIIIALIGIANTLALSILERTHELGLLRAVGMTRRQLRAAIRWESVLIALLGTTLGAGVGLFLGWALVRALRDDGFTELRIPISQLVVVFVVAVAAGVLAATQPARRAAKLDILRAISTQ
jgi:putative ABC transport system permease protein